MRLVSTDHILQGSDSLAQEMVSHTSDVLPVLNHSAQPLLEHGQVIEEVTFAAPEVVGEAEVADGGGGGELPDGKCLQQVAVQPQHCQRLQTGECLLGDGWK